MRERLRGGTRADDAPYPRGRRRALAWMAGFVAATLSLACQSASTSLIGPTAGRCVMSAPGGLPAVAPDGGTGTFSFTVPAECVWSAASGAEWITITSPLNGLGPGTIDYVAAANSAAVTRTGAVLVNDHPVQLVQEGAGCRTELSHETASVAREGGEGIVMVNATQGCAWTASSGAPWLSIVGAASRVGPGSIRFAVHRNDGLSRTGTLTLAGRIFTVEQSGVDTVCSFTLGNTERSMADVGGEDVVTVTGPPSCSWTAVSHAGWITLTSGTTGIGSGAVHLQIAPNPGAARQGVVTIANRTYVVLQAGTPCAYALDAPGKTAPTFGGRVTVSVTAGFGCGWTTQSQASWINVTDGASGSGHGTVTLSVQTNLGRTRSGTVVIAGHVFTITQPGLLN